MTNMKKIITIGLIIILTSISISPTLTSIPLTKNKKNTEENNKIPIEIALSQPNNIIEKVTQEITIEDLQTLQNLVSTLKKTTSKNKITDLIDTFISFFENIGNNFKFLKPNILSGPIILSIGNQQHLLPKHIPKIKTNELFHMWHYTNEWSTTIILFKQLSSSPIKILLGRQIGFMLGFRGIYFYIPEAYTNIPNLISEPNEICIFLGTTTFSGGITF